MSRYDAMPSSPTLKEAETVKRMTFVLGKAPAVLLSALTLAGCITQENDLAGYRDAAPGDGSVVGDAGADGAGNDAAIVDATDDAVTPADVVGDVAGDAATDAPSDAVVDAPKPCPYVLCEDFEKGTVPTGWTVEQDRGSATVQSARVAHGKYAARFHLDAGGRHARFVDKVARPSIEGHLFGRVYLSFDALPDPHSYFFVSGPADGSHYEVGSYEGGYQLTWWKPGEEKPTGGGALPMGKWWCLEFEITDAPSGIVAWTDGTEGARLNTGGTGLVGAMKERSIGFKTFDTTTSAYDVYADDLALDTKRIGCL